MLRGSKKYFTVRSFCRQREGRGDAVNYHMSAIREQKMKGEEKQPAKREGDS